MRSVVRFTDLTDGSFALGEPAEMLERRRRAMTPHPVTWLRQVHGAGVVVVDEPGAGAGSAADAAVTACPGAALSVITADCAPVAFASDHAIGVAHAGWRGLVGGVIEATVDAVRAYGDAPITAWLGPCIRPRCYEFGAADLQRVVEMFGEQSKGRTSWGTPALDVPAALRGALEAVGVHDLVDCGVCTACSSVHFSHRARSEAGRQAAFAWLEP